MIHWIAEDHVLGVRIRLDPEYALYLNPPSGRPILIEPHAAAALVRVLRDNPMFAKRLELLAHAIEAEEQQKALESHR